MEDIFAKLYDMTAFSNIIADPSFLVMYAIAFILLYLGIKKHYEPLLLVPIAFGVLIANFPGGEMGVIQADENGNGHGRRVMKNIWEMPLHEIAHDLGLMNFIYYMLIKTGFLPPVIFMGVGALTDFGPMLRNLRLSIFGAAAQLGIFTVLLCAVMYRVQLRRKQVRWALSVVPMVLRLSLLPSSWLPICWDRLPLLLILIWRWYRSSSDGGEAVLYQEGIDD